MYIKSKKGYCEFWNQGEYFDTTTGQCEDWDRTCGLYWHYQTSWFEWQEGEFLDTDTLTCVTACNYPKISINDSQFSVENVWRSPNFYVNPSSTSILEIGSIEHPYKSMKPLMSEILNHHSNQDKEISIYIKENTNMYLEDETNYIINITKVSLTSYSDSGSDPIMATLYPTKTVQSGENKKTAFSILQNTDLDLDKVIAESDMTVAEIGRIQIGDVTILLLRSNFEMSNIEVKKEYSDSEIGSRFLLPVYLQDKLVNITNWSFNLSDRILYSLDPLNIHFENNFIDPYALTYGIASQTTWNYPEASTTWNIYVNNITMTFSSDQITVEAQDIFGVSGSSNASVTNINIIGKLLQ